MELIVSIPIYNSIYRPNLRRVEAFKVAGHKQLSCPKDVLHHQSDINHAYRQCMKKGPRQDTPGPWICPNQI